MPPSEVPSQQQQCACCCSPQGPTDKLMAQGLMPLAGSLTAVHRDAVPVMAVYLPKPSSHSHRVQWPVPIPSGINSTSTSSRTSRNRSGSSSGEPPKALSEPVYGTLCSKHSRHEAYVLFINNTPHTVRLMWVNYRGDEIAYDTLLPGHSCIQQTFATHPWVAREVHTATRLPINMQEAFCPHKTQRAQQGPQAPSAAAAAGVPAAAAVAHAAAPAGPQDAAAAAAGAAVEAPAGAQQPQQPPQPQQQQVFSFQGPTGVRHVPFSSLQRAEITLLPALPWSESAHTHFPPAFKAAAKTFLLCHLQLQQAMHADHSFGLSPAAAESAAGAAAADAAEFRSSYYSDMPSPASRSHLGCLPSLLLPHIVGLAAPYAPQHMELPLALRPDILPTCLAEDPDAPVPTVPEEAEDEWHVAPDQQQQQGGGAGGGLVGAIQAAGAAAGAGAGGNGGVADVGDHAGVQVMGYVPLIDAGVMGGNGVAGGGAVGVPEPAGALEPEGVQDDAMVE